MCRLYSKYVCTWVTDCLGFALPRAGVQRLQLGKEGQAETGAQHRGLHEKIQSRERGESREGSGWVDGSRRGAHQLNGPRQ